MTDEKISTTKKLDSKHQTQISQVVTKNYGFSKARVETYHPKWVAKLDFGRQCKGQHNSLPSVNSSRANVFLPPNSVRTC